MRAMANPARSRQNRWPEAEDMNRAAHDWAGRIGVRAIQIQVHTMRNKWASISTAGRLTLNTELLKIPRELGDFVIVHKLVHLLAPNHGRVFKSFMQAYLPDWEELELRLRTLNDIKTPTK